jgi:hypothetical protein
MPATRMSIDVAGKGSGPVIGTVGPKPTGHE